jgi:hypothetical protein
MGSICKEILTVAGADEVWSAVRDIGALHTRLVPGVWDGAAGTDHRDQ